MNYDDLARNLDTYGDGYEDEAQPNKYTIFTYGVGSTMLLAAHLRRLSSTWLVRHLLSGELHVFSTLPLGRFQGVVRRHADRGEYRYEVRHDY
jgi:hypothetical protein